MQSKIRKFSSFYLNVMFSLEKMDRENAWNLCNESVFYFYTLKIFMPVVIFYPSFSRICHWHLEPLPTGSNSYHRYFYDVISHLYQQDHALILQECRAKIIEMIDEAKHDGNETLVKSLSDRLKRLKI